MSRRVVITGMGTCSPLGLNVQDNWANLISGASGLARVSRFNPERLRSQIAGQVNLNGLDEGVGSSDVEQIVSLRDQKRMDQFILFGMVAAEEAMEEAGVSEWTEEQKLRAGAVMGIGIGGLPSIEGRVRDLVAGRRLPPTWLPSVLSNLLPGHLSMKYGLRADSFSTCSACSSSGHALGIAYQNIITGNMDLAVAGGAEGAVCELAMAGFDAMRALSSSWNDTPDKASRPWDVQRDGFVIAEGAGVLVLEEYEHARARGATIHAELLGYASTSDAYHVAAPHPEGDGAARCMTQALKVAKVLPEQVGHVNAHGTSTPAGDEAEILGMKRALGDAARSIPVCSTKASTGHLLGASGALESIFAIKGLQNNVVPFTRNTENVSPDVADMNIVVGEPLEKEQEIVMSNSFGFGGANTTLVFGKI